MLADVDRLNGTNISECFRYVYLDREVNMANDLGVEQEETSGLGSFKSVEEVAKKTKNGIHTFCATVHRRYTTCGVPREVARAASGPPPCSHSGRSPAPNLFRRPKR
ncbi:unnamed protein product [Heligmosomoides polygyrus]|uniref:Piwi domain-containing protein n=1 Tax=Heligmosomoides polygyrus TaxID=6339 RepID=A0A183GXI8_HELPZ|nr:unnamed protein product [Heligmosomoides polygyrus]